MYKKILPLIAPCLFLKACCPSGVCEKNIATCPETAQQGPPTKKIPPASLLQAFRGSSIARNLEKDDLLMAAAIAQNLFATGQPSQTAWWRNDHSGNSGEIQLMHQTNEGITYCVTYTQHLSIKRKGNIKSYGKACRDHTGSLWHIVTETPLNNNP